MMKSIRMELGTNKKHQGQPTTRRFQKESTAAASKGIQRLESLKEDPKISHKTNEDKKNKKSERPHIIFHPLDCSLNTMLAEITISTSNNIQGEIFCYQAMFPQDNSKN